MKKKSSEPSNSTNKARKKEGKIPSTIQTTTPANKLTAQRELLKGILDDKELLELAVDGILIGSHDGIIIGANSYMQKLTGRPLDNLVGMHVRELFHGDELNKVPLRFDLLQKGETVLSERNILRPDGTIVPIEMHTKMMPNGTYQSIYHDITKRVAAEKALRDNEEKYRKTFLTSPDAIMITRLKDGMCVSINNGFTKIMGYTEKDILGTTTLDLNIWVEPEERKRLTEGLIKDGFVENLESRFRKKNGEICFGLVSASPLELAGIPHLISVTRDITDRKKAEENIKKINRLYVVLSNINQAIVRIKNQQELLDKACRIAIDDGKFVMAWIGMVNNVTSKVDVISNAGVTKDYLSKINIDLKNRTRSSGIVETAIKNGTHNISNDIINDRSMAPWKEDALKQGYSSAAAFPIIVSGKTIGSFALYAGEVNFFDQDEINLLDELTMDISFALEAKQQEVLVKKTEEELRKKEDQMRLLVEGTPYLFFYTQNANAELTYISPSVEKITGHPVDQWYSQKHWFVTDNPINEIARETTYAHLRGEFTNNSLLLEVNHADNHPILLEIFENPIIHNGEVVGLQGVAHNITENKKAEDKLRISEKTYRGIINSIDEAIYILDNEWTFLDVNDGAVKIYGYSREELIGKNPLFVSAEGKNNIELVGEKLASAFAGKPGEFEFWGKKKNGEIFPKQVRVYKGVYFDREVVIAVAQDISARKHSEEVISNERTLLRTIIDLIPEAVYVKDKMGQKILANPKEVEICGKNSEDELIGKTDFDLYPEQHAKSSNKEDQTIMETGRAIQNIEGNYTDKKGELHWLLGGKVALRDAYGEISGVVGLTYDITRQVKSEAALRESEKQYRQLFENSPIGIYRTTPDGRILTVNPALVNMLGYTSIEECIKRNLEEDPNSSFDRSIFKERLEREGYVAGLEAIWFKRDKSPIYIRENAQAVRDEDGKLLFYDGTVEDITKSKLAEQKLKESEDLFRNLVENIADVFYIVNAQGKIKYCSPNFFVLTGFSQHEILEHHFVRIIAPVDRRQAVEHYNKETTRGVLDTNLEVRVARKDGQIHWVEQNTRIVRDEKGEVLEYRNVARDITERKQVENALRESEATFRKLFEESADSILLLDDTGFFACNEATVTLLGYTTKEEFLRKQPWEVSPERQPDGMLSSEKAVLMISKAARQGYNRFEWIHLKADGTEFPVEVLLTLIVIKGKQVFHTIWRDITERKFAENALRASEERFRIISNLTSDYIFSTIIHDDGIIESDWVMGAFEKISGYSIEEYKSIGGWRGIIHPEDIEKDDSDFEKLKNNEEVISEIRIQNKNGNIVWCKTYAHPVWDEKAKKLVRVYGAVEDITEKKYAEELINESEKKFREIAEGTKAILFNTNTRGQFTYANQAASDALGRENKDLLGKFYLDFVHPEDRERVHDYFSSQLKNNERDHNLDFRYIKPSGKIGWLSFLVSMLYIDGELAGLTGVAQEITERKQTEEALRKSELHFRSVWENSASGMRLTDENGIIVAVNSSFCSLVGKTKQELEGSPLSIIYKTQDSFNVQNKYRERFEKRTVKKLIENEFVLWNGKKIWLRVANSFIESEHEKPFLLGIFTDITEQKLAEREIKKLSQAVEQSAGSIVITDLNGNIEYINKKFEEVTGYTFAEVKGQNPRFLKSGETPKEEYKKMWNTILAENEWRGTFHNKRKDGSLYWEATTISAIKNNEGEITNFLAIKDDITQDKLKEELLKKSELHFRSIWESSLDGMRLTDENGIIVSVNDAFAKLFEKNKEDIIGKSFAVVYGKNSGFNDVASFARRFAERTIQPFMERDITLWNDKPMSVELTNSFVEVEGQPPLLLSIFKNVTEKKQSEQKIQLLAHSIESIGECVSITEINNRILFVNDAFIKTYGYSREELIGNDISIIRPERDTRENLQQIFSSTLNGGWKGEVVNRRKDGTTFPVYLSTSVIKDSEWNPIALVGVSSDITDTKKSREELILAKEKAEEANKVKTNFLENMSHELRTPMISILGFTELMTEMELPDEVINMAAMMNKSGNRLMDTLNIILDLAQIEKERIIVKPTEVNILNIIDEVCGLLQPMANERNLYLKKEYPADSLMITTDGRMLRHMLNNLINNGLKFTPKGGVTVTATVAKEGDGNFAIINIRDTGIGIPKDQQEIIWEEFRQASEGIGRSFEGNGLGLTITKSFIEKLNGKILLESEVGVGTTFTIKLPMSNDLTTTKEIPVKEENSVEKQIVNGEPLKPEQLRKVLYVEDEEISFSVVKHFLKGIVLLDWAKSGQEGVVMARGNKYDAILMDINLARGIDGMQTTKLVRALPEYQQTPIIAITAYAMRGDKEEFLSVGCSHYISKPFSRAALLNLMEDVFKEK